MRKRRPEWLRWERVYGELGLKNFGSRCRRDYRAYLERRLEEVRKDDRRRAHERWGKIRRGWCLGSEGFIAVMKGKLKELARKGHDQESWAGKAVEAMEEDLAESDTGIGGVDCTGGGGKECSRNAQFQQPHEEAGSGGQAGRITLEKAGLQ
ncbi:MAG: hypothetical protein HY360_00395 [Verrucomicrobia bacterium]|nr:hypothetical protein [Verrucomicrobiota bacterium]